jgi:peptidylprolyl isomerase
VPTNKQRREAERRHLERQLRNRRIREERRRKITLITSVSLTIVLIAAIIITVVLLSGGSDNNNKNQAASSKSATASATASPSPSTSASVAPVGTPAACLKPVKDKTVTFKGVTVKNPTDLSKDPDVTSKSSTDPTALECQDLVVGKGKAATPSSQVSVQYAGVLYKDGTEFDSSWKNGGTPATFSLTGVVPGFTQGIGGTGKVTPMREGGRRILILPAALGYGDQASGKIPANAALVFVVDLKKVG